MAMSAVKGDLIKDIDDVKDTWRLYAKVLTKWTILKRIPPFPIWKLGLLLVDAEAWGDLEDVKNDNTTTKRLKFTIADINENSINVILYGDSATRTFNSKPDDLEPPIVVMVRFARILKGKAYGHITNQCEGTKAIFNPDIAEARSLRESLKEKPDASQSLSQISNCVVSTLPNESMLTFPCRMTISQIFQLKQKGEVVTKVTIQKLETFYGWYYDGCPCDKKPLYVADSDKLTCPGCNKAVLMTEPK
ncbi:uncharacterized protein LOC114759677 [Neltuma alba]|uniref:uncharacterized protein LOC114759677 n=1 Tax=Neltuma alba TaxID=207710 RepID=UPI0010A33CC0|nr:uncharacterized protein LOC114759677 [Prosopis alba]